MGREPGAGFPGAIHDIASLFHIRSERASADAAETRRAIVALAAAESEATDAVKPKIARMHAKFVQLAVATTHVRIILDEYGFEVADLRRQADAVLSDARVAWAHLWERRAEALNAASEFVWGWTLDWDQVMPSWLYSSDESHLRRWQHAIDEFCHARDAYRRLADRRAELDAHTRDRLRQVPLFASLTADWTMGDRAVTAAGEAWAGDVGGITVEDLAAVSDPAMVRTIWDALGDEQQRELILAAPLVLGGLAGLPPWARVAANRLNAKSRIASLRRMLVAGERSSDPRAPRPYPAGPARDPRRLRAELEYLERVASGEVQLYSYDHETHSIVEMIGEIGPGTTDINTYLPGTFTSAWAFYHGETQQVGRWLNTNSQGSIVTFVWKVGEFPGEDKLTGAANLSRIAEANDEQRALRKGREIADFHRELVASTRGTKVDYNGIGFSWGLAGITAAEVAGARFDAVVSLAGAGMPSTWTPRLDTTYEHFSYTDALSMAQATGQVWEGRNPGRHPGFTSHIYAHEGDYTMKIKAPVPWAPEAQIPANRDPIATHNLIATDDPENEQALLGVREALR